MRLKGLKGGAGPRAATVVTAAAALIGVAALPAAAHVSVNPKEATVGSTARLTFRVPTESDTASTVKVEVVFPEDAPFASVSVKPVAGWTVTMEKRKLSTPIKHGNSQVTEAVSKITWMADGTSAVKPGQYQEFDVSAGPVPEVQQVIFKALQTYSDGNIVRWIDEPKAGAEAEHPAPVLKVLPKADASAAPVAANNNAANNAANNNTASGDSGASGNGWAIGLSALALLVALAALGLSLRRKAEAPAA